MRFRDSCNAADMYCINSDSFSDDDDDDDDAAMMRWCCDGVAGFSSCTWSINRTRNIPDRSASVSDLYPSAYFGGLEHKLHYSKVLKLFRQMSNMRQCPHCLLSEQRNIKILNSVGRRGHNCIWPPYWIEYTLFKNSFVVLYCVFFVFTVLIVCFYTFLYVMHAIDMFLMQDNLLTYLLIKTWKLPPDLCTGFKLLSCMVTRDP